MSLTPIKQIQYNKHYKNNTDSLLRIGGDHDLAMSFPLKMIRLWVILTMVYIVYPYYYIALTYIYIYMLMLLRVYYIRDMLNC